MRFWGGTVRAVLLSGLLFIGSVAVHGQSNVGSIFGRISDSSGGAIPGASVLLVNPATNEKLNVVTSETGDYVFNLVRPATYDMSASFAGFKTVQRSGIVLQVAEKLGVDLTLEPGDISQKVEVHGDAALLQPGSSDIGTVINSRTIVDLPLEGRNVYQLVTLVPGSAANPTYGYVSGGNNNLSGGPGIGLNQQPRAAGT